MDALVMVPSMPGWRTEEDPPHVARLDTMLPRLSDGDHTQYWGGGTRPTAAQQLSWLSGTPTPGPRFQVQPGEPCVDKPFGHGGNTLGNVDKPSASHLQSPQSTRPAHNVSGRSRSPDCTGRLAQLRDPSVDSRLDHNVPVPTNGVMCRASGVRKVALCILSTYQD